MPENQAERDKRANERRKQAAMKRRLSIGSVVDAVKNVIPGGLVSKVNEKLKIGE